MKLEILKFGVYTQKVFLVLYCGLTLLSNFEAQIRQKHLRNMAPLK